MVEDDEAIRDFLKTQLQETYNILTFCNGKEALPEIIKQIGRASSRDRV